MKEFICVHMLMYICFPYAMRICVTCIPGSPKPPLPNSFLPPYWNQGLHFLLYYHPYTTGVFCHCHRVIGPCILYHTDLFCRNWALPATLYTSLRELLGFYSRHNLFLWITISVGSCCFWCWVLCQCLKINIGRQQPQFSRTLLPGRMDRR